MKTKFIAIAALGSNRQLGLEGALPWNIPDEYEHFKRIVRGHYVLTGRKNFDAHKKMIDETKPLVLSKSNTDYFQDMKQVIAFAEKNLIETIFVIGGGEIYNLTLPYLSEFYCSIVDYDGPADTYFPEYRFYDWEVLNQEVHSNWSMYHLKKRPDF